MIVGYSSDEDMKVRNIVDDFILMTLMTSSYLLTPARQVGWFYCF